MCIVPKKLDTFLNEEASKEKIYMPGNKLKTICCFDN